MPAPTLSLDDIRVASPCKASWEAMTGDDCVRFCAQCRLNVYNLSAMSRSEASTFLSQRNGRTCVRFYQRHDGTLLTRDCPVGLAAWRRRLLVGAVACGVLALGIFSTIAIALGSSAQGPDRHDQRMGFFQRVWDTLFPPPPVVMGGLCPPGVPPPPANPEEMPAPDVEPD